MRQQDTEQDILRSTCIFLVFLLLAGLVNLMGFSGIAELESLMASCNYLIYVGLLLYWFRSVRDRLLPTRAKGWVMSAALLMLLYQLLRVFKYRFATEPGVHRYLVYLYFVPMVLIPTLFLMTCLRIRRGNHPGRWDEALLLIPPGLLLLITLTNDLHGLVYAPRVALSQFALDTGTYAHGPVFYALCIWMILSFAAGLILLLWTTARRPGKALVFLLVVVALWLGLLIEFLLIHDGVYGPRMYNSPEINMFGMLGVFEVCIHYRLIPHNANYAAFFGTLQTPSLVTDGALQPVYYSASKLTAEAEQLRAALLSPVYLTPDLKLSGHPVRGGFAFWTEDETQVHLAQDRLAEANELIESENSLIQAETEQREKDAWLQSRHRIYHEIAETLYPCQQRIERLLSRMEPDTPAFRDQLAQVSVLNAYVKRKTNLLLVAAEQNALTAHALFLALRESAGYLSLAGLRTAAQEPEEEQALPAAVVIALYDAFEAVAEQLMGKAPSLMVSWQGDALVLATETPVLPDVSALPVPARVQEEDGILYLDLLAQAKETKGGERA